MVADNFEEETGALKIIARGIVQGVGFRPYIYKLARNLGYSGYVQNTDSGVVIVVEGEHPEHFLDAIRKNLPPLADLKELHSEQLDGPRRFRDFRILESEDRGGSTLLSPDISVCDDCLAEMEDRHDRRYLYPFINCTNCGPRYTITRQVPYDRPNTTMISFTMCGQCESEYHDPSSRRFHAQPNACHVCGPRLSLKVTSPELTRLSERDPLLAAIEMLCSGHIVAIKGIGGFHIACDATHEKAVRLLRQRKRKSNKPFALMALDIQSIDEHCYIDDGEKELLNDQRRPIVLLKKRPVCDNYLRNVSPGNSYLGFMLPYTPLHRLLFSHPGAVVRPRFLVMTSGNLSEEPIVADNENAVTSLSGLVDAFLMHDRGIYMRVDDSVVFRLNAEKTYPATFFVRRARGYVPQSVRISPDGPDVLGAGADLKNTFTLAKGENAIMSQHIGDMENYESLRFFESTLQNLRNVFRVDPVAVGYDPHPGYMATRWALEQQIERKIPVLHHHAHVASVAAEHSLEGNMIGVIFDGTGFGPDNTLWGGEFFTGDVLSLERRAHLKQTPLVGGESSIRNPWKTAVSMMQASAGSYTHRLLDQLGFFQRFGEQEVANVLKLADKRQFSPLSSGAGRVFDAVAALTGVCDRNTFEAEAPMRLEALVDGSIRGSYPYSVSASSPIEFDLSPSILAIADDMCAGKKLSGIATRFHNTMIAVILDGSRILAEKTGIRTVVLSGGVFQNRYILKHSLTGLSAAGFDVYTNVRVPGNDACISLGQAYIVRNTLSKENGFG